jgi:hypothetical protein
VLAVAGAPVKLDASASGAELDMEWQWYKDGQILADQKNRLLRIASAAPGDVASYTAEVSNSVGTTIVGPIALSLTEPAPLALTIDFFIPGPRLTFSLEDRLQARLEGSSDLVDCSTVWGGHRLRYSGILQKVIGSDFVRPLVVRTSTLLPGRKAISSLLLYFNFLRATSRPVFTSNTIMNALRVPHSLASAATSFPSGDSLACVNW